MKILETTTVQYRPAIRLTPPADMPQNDAAGVIRGVFWLLQNEYHEVMTDYYLDYIEQTFCLCGDLTEDRTVAESQGAGVIKLLQEILPANWSVN
ncbi:hypothetical protein IACHDJAJ_00018 [Aeromonas phage vB_AdhS_TS3]|nr:hypothetical protein IACHDJAJ_00018 [Aeromonas phage vB_AdhS_TS3]